MPCTCDVQASTSYVELAAKVGGGEWGGSQGLVGRRVGTGNTTETKEPTKKDGNSPEFRGFQVNFRGNSFEINGIQINFRGVRGETLKNT